MVAVHTRCVRRILPPFLLCQSWRCFLLPRPTDPHIVSSPLQTVSTFMRGEGGKESGWGGEWRRWSGERRGWRRWSGEEVSGESGVVRGVSAQPHKLSLRWNNPPPPFPHPFPLFSLFQQNGMSWKMYKLTMTVKKARPNVSSLWRRCMNAFCVASSERWLMFLVAYRSGQTREKHMRRI